MKINDILAFNKERYFNGAIQAEWFYDPLLSYEIGSTAQDTMVFPTRMCRPESIS